MLSFFNSKLIDQISSNLESKKNIKYFPEAEARTKNNWKEKWSERKKSGIFYKKCFNIDTKKKTKVRILIEKQKPKM